VNQKLIRRSEEMLQKISARSLEEVRHALRQSKGNVKLAVLLLRGLRPRQGPEASRSRSWRAPGRIAALGHARLRRCLSAARPARLVGGLSTERIATSPVVLQTARLAVKTRAGGIDAENWPFNDAAMAFVLGVTAAGAQSAGDTGRTDDHGSQVPGQTLNDPSQQRERTQGSIGAGRTGAQGGPRSQDAPAEPQGQNQDQGARAPQDQTQQRADTRQTARRHPTVLLSTRSNRAASAA